MKPFHKKVYSKVLREINLSKGVKPPYADQFVTVFSHPRSGTHFMEAFLAQNFYQNRLNEFKTKDIGWGHWANSQVIPNGNRFWKLFGSHYFPDKRLKKIDYPIIYIHRDGRAVAYSIWKTDNFIHPKHKGISFSDFLRIKLDWKGSPGRKTKPKLNIIQHWEKHVQGWLDIAQSNENILIIKYEDVIDSPYAVYETIHNVFFSDKEKIKENELNIIANAVGLKPNRAVKDSWKDVFSDNDLEFFNAQMSNPNFLKDFN